MGGVRGPVGQIVRHFLDQVTDVVQKRRDDQRGWCSRGACEVRGLQAVLGHRDALAEIRALAPIAVELKDFFENGHGASADRGPRSRAAALYTLSRVK